MKKPNNAAFFLLPFLLILYSTLTSSGQNTEGGQNDDPDDAGVTLVTFPTGIEGTLTSNDNDYWSISNTSGTFEPLFTASSDFNVILAVFDVTDRDDPPISTFPLSPGIEIELTGGVAYSINLVRVGTGPPVTYTIAFVAGDGVDNNAAPVEWLSFEGETLAEGVRLFWNTATEENNQGFGIERSRDAQSWETLDFVKGVGTTQDIQEYSYLDLRPYEGLNYYRLKQTDYNGDFDYSSIVEVAVGIDLLSNHIQVFPNPARNHLRISPLTGAISIHDLSGRRLYRISADGSWSTLDVSSLPVGAYFLITQPLSGPAQYTRFLKN